VLRESDAGGEGGGGDGVGGGDDGAEDESGLPVECGDEVVREACDAEHGEGYEAEGEHSDVNEVAAELTPVGLPGGGVEQRWEKDEECEIGLQRDAWDVGHERDGRTGDGEEDGIWDLDSLRDGSEDGDQQEQEENDDLDLWRWVAMKGEFSVDE
jgi:hypothetical protein